MDTLQHYDNSLENTRNEFSNYVKNQLRNLSPEVLLLFLLYHAAYGVEMTRHVEEWIKKAAQKCQEIGYNDIGKQLAKHAAHEKDHHLMNINDIKTLVAAYNKKFNASLDVNNFLNIEPTKNIIAYHHMHEQWISSPHPYCQIAIEFEIEKISAEQGPLLMAAAIGLIGMDVISELEFIPDHVELDVAHTKFNRILIEKTLDHIPDAIEPMCEAGNQALFIYQGYLQDCIDRSIATH